MKSNPETTRRNLDLLFEIGSLRHLPRGWQQYLGSACANDLEHTLRVTFLALMLAREEGVEDEEEVLKMALLHDLAETRTGDHAYVPKRYVTTNEEQAVHDSLSGTSLSDLEELIAKYQARESLAAKVVKDADNLDCDLELRELTEQGHQLAAEWQELRRTMRDTKLYTESAKRYWDAIQKAKPSHWHVSS